MYKRKDLKAAKMNLCYVFKNTFSDSKTKINYTAKVSWAFLFNWHSSELILSTSVLAWVSWKNVKNNYYFYWGYSYFSLSRSSKQEIPFCFLAEILFCYTLKPLSKKTTTSYKRQIIQSAMVWQHAVIISTHI